MVAIDTDRLYPVHLAEEIAAAVPGAPPVDLVNSPYGHDAFLIESAAVGKVASELLETD